MAFLKKLDGKIAIVTGGTVGIGQEVCFSLAEQGVQVVVVGRNAERLDKTMQELGRRVPSLEKLGFLADVRFEDDMQHMVDHSLAHFGKIDILVSAAGILRGGDGSLKMLRDMSCREWDDVLDTNLKGVFLANRAVLPAMIEYGGGDIINLSSTSGRKGLAFDTAYCASKFAVIGLTEALATEMVQYGIRVQALLPGAIETGMWDQNGPLPKPGAILPSKRVADMIMQMLMTPDDMVLETPLIEPFARGLHGGWLGHHSSSSSK